MIYFCKHLTRWWMIIHLIFQIFSKKKKIQEIFIFDIHTDRMYIDELNTISTNNNC